MNCSYCKKDIPIVLGLITGAIMAASGGDVAYVYPDRPQYVDLST
ncbi:hypothetical protein [Nitrosopumilus sp. Nsub]|nr:hypothetical protein [Nitrosopumilus sp. Nsub]